MSGLAIVLSCAALRCVQTIGSAPHRSSHRWVKIRRKRAVLAGSARLRGRRLAPMRAPMADFVPETVLKRDLFSETRKGHFAGGTRTPMIRRIVTAAPFWSRPIGWVLARREIAVLRAVDGMAGVPQLHSVDRDGLYRSWTEGTPLHLARPADPAWYRD